MRWLRSLRSIPTSRPCGNRSAGADRTSDEEPESLTPHPPAKRGRVMRTHPGRLPLREAGLPVLLPQRTAARANSSHTLQSESRVLLSSARPPRVRPLDPQVARKLRLRNRLRVVLPIVDELDRHHLGCPDERTAGSFFGHDVDPITECRSAYGPESPHPLVGVAEVQQQIVLLSIRKRDDDLHRPQRLRPVRRQRPAVGSAPRSRRSTPRSRSSSSLLRRAPRDSPLPSRRPASSACPR